MHQLYCESFSEFGDSVKLSRCGGWILKRKVPGTTFYDAMGCYPIFSCLDWSRLPEDLISLDGDFVSLTLVTDSFGEYDDHLLTECFPDLCIPFKRHYIVELAQQPGLFVHPHHQRNASKALQKVSVVRSQPSETLLDEWIGLYYNLISRHNIRGISAFSPDSFATQFRVPGLEIFRAEHEGVCAGMILWYVQGDVAYYHLGAYSPKGYELKASFALFWESIEYFRERGIRCLSLGAGAGMQQKDDGLTRFKSGWATGTRTAYLCGRICNPEMYNTLIHKSGVAGSAYFPAYREGETA